MLRKPKLVVDLLRHVLPKYFGYIINIVGFVVFLCLNGSIVIGDKSAHVAKLHVPQVCTVYLLSFTKMYCCTAYS